jgi:MFS family permease
MKVKNRSMSSSNGGRGSSLMISSITAYTLAFGGLLLLGGRIADYTGRRRAFLIGLFGFAGASALGGAAPGFGVLLAARACQARSARCSPRPRCRCSR